MRGLPGRRAGMTGPGRRGALRRLATVPAIAVSLVLGLAGCASPSPSSAPSTSPAGSATIVVVTTTTILADLVQQVGGSRVVVTTVARAR